MRSSTGWLSAVTVILHSLQSYPAHLAHSRSVGFRSVSSLSSSIARSSDFFFSIVLFLLPFCLDRYRPAPLLQPRLKVTLQSVRVRRGFIHVGDIHGPASFDVRAR